MPKTIYLQPRGPGIITTYGKWCIAMSMHSKGLAFLRAAVLLRRQGPEHEAVVLHLLCQGLENVLKAALLARNYDTYKPLLKRPLGHHLSRLFTAAQAEFGIRSRKPEAEELDRLSKYYEAHLLRYGTNLDFCINPKTIPSDRVLRLAVAMRRLSEREFGRHFRAQVAAGRWRTPQPPPTP